jgi:hypothetical protein
MTAYRDKYTWKRNASETEWVTWRSHRGYTGSITRTGGAAYELTITGTGAPAAASYPSLKRAKNAFRKFLTAKPVS